MDSPRWEQVNPSAFDHERAGLRALASYLPDEDPFHVWANVEFVGTDGSINDVDALVLTPSGLVMIELKHWQGELSGDGMQWVRRPPGGRLTPWDNPYILVNRKAKRLASVITLYARKQSKEPPYPYVNAAVFLHAEELKVRLDELGRKHVYGPDGHPGPLPSLKEFLLAVPAGPDRLVDSAKSRRIIAFVRGAKIRPSVANRRIGQLILHPRPVAEGVGWQDFLAGHSLDRNLVRRVRFYLISRAEAEDVPAIKRAAEREFRLLQGIHHPGIVHPVDYVDHSIGPAVAFDHTAGSVRLDQWLAQHERKLTTAQKLHVVQDLAEIVEYAHSRRLSHRAMHPRAVFVLEPERSRPPLSITDWQTGGRLAGSTQVTRLSSTGDGAGLELFFDDEVRRYQAPEATTSSQAPGVPLDVFGLGAIAYRIFTGNPPADNGELLVEAVRNRGLNLAAVADGMPESLVSLVYDATHGDPGQRPASASAFRQRLDAVWDELTEPEPAPVIDPLEAKKGDDLGDGLAVIRRLGSGATATAFLVSHGTGEHRREVVLKVARDERHADRLKAEAETLGTLKDWQVAALIEPARRIGGRTTLLLESAGPRTLAEELRGGRLAIDLLDRYGRDLLDIVAFLDGQGVWHRDLKPANLAARPRPRDKQLHLCVFDFSLATIAADELHAGTAPYLDPFLGEPGRVLFDAAAERFAAAVTLYEMATGSLPRWGENANPAAVIDEVTLEPSAFDPDIADRLVAFFGKALARAAAARFDTIDEMADAWRAIFREIPPAAGRPAPAAGRPAPGSAPLTRETPLEATDLTARARSALQRLGVHSVGELVDYQPSALTRAQGIPDATRKEILALARTLRPRLAAEAAAAAAAAPERPQPAEPEVAVGIEAVCATLLSRRNDKERGAMRVMLGQAQAEAGGGYLRWPTQTEVANGTGESQPQISIWLRKYAKRWLGNPALSQVRDEIVSLLDARGSVMSAEELAEALAATRGSFTADPARLPQAIGLVRAAVETELARGGDARLALRRFRNSDLVLIGRESDDPSSGDTAAKLLDYAVALGQRASMIAAADPLFTRQRAVEALRAVPVPAGAEALSEQRLLQLADAASNGTAAVNAQGLLYPVGMPGERALRLAASTLVGHSLSADGLRERVRARFPEAEPLPWRPDLDRLLKACGLPLVWQPEKHRYDPPTWHNSATGTRMATTGPLAGPADAADIDTKIKNAIARTGFVALLTPVPLLAGARRALLAHYRLAELDVTAVLLDQLRGLGFPWEAVLAADNGNAADPDFRGLTELVAHHVVPAITAELQAAKPILITESAPLARYGQLKVLRELVDPTIQRPAARFLLLPARRPEPVMIDQTQVPLTAPRTQSLWLPKDWIDAMPPAGVGSR